MVRMKIMGATLPLDPSATSVELLAKECPIVVEGYGMPPKRINPGERATFIVRARSFEALRRLLRMPYWRWECYMHTYAPNVHPISGGAR